jgi:uncharacterized protein YjbI with pentapeptide repeats
MERLNCSTYKEATIRSRNAEEALLAVLSVCGDFTQELSDISWESPHTFRKWLARLQNPAEEGLIIFVDRYLSWLNLEWANLRGASLEEANLEKANLEEANLWNAYLVGANLRGANLRGANFRGAYLKWANLEETSLEGATFLGSNVEEAKIEPDVFRKILKKILKQQ